MTPVDSMAGLMNYFAHALNHLDRPYFMAGTAIPDWLSVADRKVRLRPRLLEPWLDGDEEVQCQVAAGALQHLNDDDWFHATRGFAEITGELTARFRRRLGGSDEYHCGFLGHVGMELLLDGVLMELYPERFEQYWNVLATVDSMRIEHAVNRMAKVPAERLAWFVDLFRREQFLRSYDNDDALLRRLNQVLSRVKLMPIPVDSVDVVADGRILVRQRLQDLLPAEFYQLP